MNSIFHFYFNTMFKKLNHTAHLKCLDDHFFNSKYDLITNYF